MKKRLVALMLVGVVGATTVMGCGSSDAKSDDKGANKDATAEDVVEDGVVNGLMKAEGLPLVPNMGDYEFSMFCDGSAQDSSEYWMMNEFEKQTNVKVDLRQFPYETATERLNLDLNSGDYADVIGGWLLSDSSILTYGVNQGVFIPLEDYFEKYCPKITEILNLPGVREKMTAPDGHIYTIPYVCGDTTIAYGPWINDIWLENVGLEQPETPEEFEAALKAFKEQDANKNGDKNDEIPFSADPNNKNLDSMAGWFGVPMNNLGEAVMGDKVMFAGFSKQYREFLSWFNGLYEQGLIDQELFTQDIATFQGKGKQDLYGCAIAYGSGEFSGIPATEEKPPYTPVMLNKDNGGVWQRATTGFSVYRTQAVITDKAEHPEIICRWFDNAFELENGIGCNIGPVGTSVFKEGDGYRAVDREKEFDEDMQAKLEWGALWPQCMPKYLPKGFEVASDVQNFNEKKYQEEFMEPYLTENVRPSFWIPQDKVDAYADSAAVIKDFYQNQQALFISGEQDVNDDAVWQAYVDGLTALGLEEWMEIRGIEGILE